MKQEDKLDKLFEKTFENHSFDYDANQWSALEKKLNQRIIAKRLKWLFGSAAILLGLVMGIYLLSIQKDDNLNPPTQDSNGSSKMKSAQSVEDNSSSVSEKESDSNDQQTDWNEEDSKQNTMTPPNEDQSNVSIAQKIEIDNSNYNEDNAKIKSDTASSIMVSPHEIPKSLHLGDYLPNIGHKCLKDLLSFSNSNIDNLYLVNPKMEKTIVRPQQDISIILEFAGRYSIFTEGRENNLSTQFTVSELPEINLLSSNELNYENGLPEFKLEVQPSEGTIEWKVNGKIDYSNQNRHLASLCLFNKGMNTMKVAYENEKGCAIEKSTVFEVVEDYNLLAVNAFSPNSLDYRNQSFMPYALIVRNTPFKLMVFDPDDGGVIFESEDALFPWEGIDKRTGKLVPLNKAYIWRVNLQNPVSGEKPIYQGTIVRF